MLTMFTIFVIIEIGILSLVVNGSMSSIKIQILIHEEQEGEHTNIINIGHTTIL